MDQDFGVAAGIGAAATLVAGVVPGVQLLAPLVGGGAAAYAHDAAPREGAKVGAAAGLLSLAVYLPLFAVGVGWLAALGAMSPAPAGLGVLATSLLVVATLLIPVMGAFGGVLGGGLLERDRQPRAGAETVGELREGARSRGRSDSEEGRTGDRPIDRLERRYVEGELSEAEFERRLNTLLEQRRRRERAADPDPVDRELER